MAHGARSTNRIPSARSSMFGAISRDREGAKPDREAEGHTYLLFPYGHWPLPPLPDVTRLGDRAIRTAHDPLSDR